MRAFLTQDISQLTSDAGPPLNGQDFLQGNLLPKEDQYPSDGGLALYSSGHFEGDIIAPLVRLTSWLQKTFS